MARQQAGIGLTDEANAERVDEAIKADGSTISDRLFQVADLELAPAIELGEQSQLLLILD